MPRNPLAALRATRARRRQRRFAARLVARTAVQDRQAALRDLAEDETESSQWLPR